MVLDFILTILLSITVNVLVTKPCARLLDLFMRKSEKTVVTIDNKNELKLNGKQKLPEEAKDNDVVVIKNVVFENSPVLSDKQLANDSWLQNLIPNNLDGNNNFPTDDNTNINEANRDVSIKL